MEEKVWNTKDQGKSKIKKSNVCKKCKTFYKEWCVRYCWRKKNAVKDREITQKVSVDLQSEWRKLVGVLYKLYTSNQIKSNHVYCDTDDSKPYIETYRY